MQSRRERFQEDLFVASPLRDLIPDDHILKRVDAILDLSWVHEEVRGVYCQDNGRPSIDPESALRLMLAGFFQGIVRDRHLMREAQVNLAIRWFAGYRLDEALPDRSSLTCIRQHWGAAASLYKTVTDDDLEIRFTYTLDSYTAGLARTARRGLRNAATQSYLTAAVMNLKKLAATGTLRRTIRTLTSALTTHLRRTCARLVQQYAPATRPSFECPSSLGWS
jgi:hypothetical protein